MIRFKIAELLAQRRLSLTELSDRTGISVSDLEVLRDQRAMAVRLKTLDCLCKALSCQPGDLLAWRED
ncbi:MAG: helix-turn-helix domain-containing protein [Asticcacaulis sp.]